VRDADATLILSFYNANVTAAGSDFTQFCAEIIYEKPWRIANAAAPRGRDGVPAWIETMRARKAGGPLTLNVAGPREAEMPGIYAASVRYLRALLGAWAPASHDGL
jgi:hypothetical protein